MASKNYDGYTEEAFAPHAPKAMPKSKFPMIHQEGKAAIENGQITFTHITSLGKVVTETKPVLTPEQIIKEAKARHERFKEAGPGSRESEESRAKRKHVSAHPESIIREAWKDMDEETRMELSMMLSMDSHYGISDPEWAKGHANKINKIQGDGGKPL